MIHLCLKEGLRRLENALESEDIIAFLDQATLSIRPGEGTPGSDLSASTNNIIHVAPSCLAEMM